MIDVKVLTHKLLYQLMSSHLIILPVEFPSKGPKFQTQKNKEVWSCPRKFGVADMWDFPSLNTMVKKNVGRLRIATVDARNQINN